MNAQNHECFGDLLARKPERLVVNGFRNCIAGYDFGDIACWENTWQSYINEIGIHPARRLMGELQFWVRYIRTGTERPLSYFPNGCRRLCHDECMVLSIISAAQHQRAVAGFLAIRHLTGLDDQLAIEEFWNASQSFAEALTQFELTLIPVPERVVRSIADMQFLSKTKSMTLN